MIGTNRADGDGQTVAIGTNRAHPPPRLEWAAWIRAPLMFLGARSSGSWGIATPPRTYKGRALSRDGRAALSVSTVERPYWIVSVVGDAAVEPLPESHRIEFVGAIAVKYLGGERGQEYLQAWLKGGHPGDGELIRIRPNKVHFYIS